MIIAFHLMLILLFKLLSSGGSVSVCREWCSFVMQLVRASPLLVRSQFFICVYFRRPLCTVNPE